MSWAILDGHFPTLGEPVTVVLLPPLIPTKTFGIR